MDSLRNCHTVFQSDYSFTSLLEVYEWLFLSIFISIWYCFGIAFILALLIGMLYYYIVVLIYTFPVANHVKNPKCCFSIFFDEILVFCVLIGLFAFLLLNFESSLYNSLDTNPLQICGSQIFSPILQLSFQLLHSVFYRTKVFSITMRFNFSFCLFVFYRTCFQCQVYELYLALGSKVFL